MKEIELFRDAATAAYKEYQASGDLSGQPTIAGYKGLLDAFARLSRLADYKQRNKKNVEPFDYSKCKDPDQNTVTLCGICLGTNQLGNMMLGIIAIRMDQVDNARNYGLGKGIYAKILGGPNPLWSEKGQLYREEAFSAGVLFEESQKKLTKDDIKNHDLSLCGIVKDMQYDLQGKPPGDPSNACSKEPCKEKYDGKNTDMKRDPITDKGGN